MCRHIVFFPTEFIPVASSETCCSESVNGSKALSVKCVVYGDMATALDVVNFFIDVFKDSPDPMTRLRIEKFVFEVPIKFHERPVSVQNAGCKRQKHSG